MNKALIAAFALASATAAAPAFAAPFDGPYVGAQVGFNRDDIGHVTTDIGDLDGGRGRNSFTGGVFAGYDYSIAPRVVVGGELGLGLTANDSLAGSVGGVPAVLDPRRQIDVTARAGYLVTPQTLVYVRGGYTNLRARVSTDSLAQSTSRTHDLDGWTLGAGTERALSSTVSARVEYRYADLGEGHGKYDRHQVLVGLAYHF